jgi:hypothetical protein
MAVAPPRCILCDSLMARSHSRSVVEKLLKLFTPLRPHRCTGCGEREWRRPAPPGEIWYPDSRDR